MITWADKIAFVGMTVEMVSKDRPNFYEFHRYNVLVRIPNGLCSYGSGNTMEEAIESGAIGMSVCWFSVERKITEREWQKMSHL